MDTQHFKNTRHFKKGQSVYIVPAGIFTFKVPCHTTQIKHVDAYGYTLMNGITLPHGQREHEFFFVFDSINHYYREKNKDNNV